MRVYLHDPSAYELGNVLDLYDADSFKTGVLYAGERVFHVCVSAYERGKVLDSYDALLQQLFTIKFHSQRHWCMWTHPFMLANASILSPSKVSCSKAAPTCKYNTAVCFFNCTAMYKSVLLAAFVQVMGAPAKTSISTMSHCWDEHEVIPLIRTSLG